MGNSTLERSRSRYHLALVLVVALTTQLLLPLASAGNRPRLSALSAKTGHNNTEPRRSLNSFQVQQDTIRQVSLTTNDIVYAKNTAQLYVSLPSAAGGNGNSVAPLTPATGVLGPSVFVGSEPGKLAISDNGQYLYVGLNGAAAVRRFDLATQTAGPQFGLGRDSTFGTYYPEDIEVMPGHPETVAVSRQRPSVTPRQGGVAIFDNSVQRTNAVGSFSGGNVIEFSSNGAALYAYENEGFGQPPFRKLTVDSNGLSVAATTSNLIPAAKDIKFDNGRIYASSGEIIDPEAATLVTKLPGMGFGALVAPESSVGRVYFLTPTNQPATTWTLRVHDQTTFALMGTLDVTNVNGTPSSLVRWGAHGLAFRTSANQLFLIETALVPSPDPIPTPTATPTPSPSPTPTPIDVSVRQLSLPTNDLVYDAPRQLIYGSVPSAAGNSGNSLAPIDPASGQIGQTVPVGSEPAKLALSDNGQYLYVALDGASAVRRFDLVTGTAGLQFSLGVSPDNTGPLSVRDIEVLPGNPNAVAISRLRPANFAPRFEGVAIYDNGVQRPTTTTSFGGAGMLEFSASANTLYGMDIETGDGFFKMAVDGNGVTNVINTQGILNGSDFKFSNGLVFATSGQVLDPETRLLTGTYSASGLVLPDPTAAKVYFLTGSGTTRILKAFDRNTFLPLGQFNVTGVTGTTGSLIRWGTDGLAFRTSSGQIFLIQTSLVSSNPNPTPTPTPTSTPTPTPTPLPTPTYSRQISLATGDLVYDSAGQKIYASIPANAGNAPNSLLPIDPIAGITGAAVVIGTDPGKLAISANNQFIYAALNGSTPGVRRFDIASQTPGLQFSLGSDSFSGNYYVQDMKVFPDNPGAIAIARRNIVSSDQHEGVVIYDDGVARPHDTQSPSSQFPSNVIVFGSTPATIYGLDTQDSAQTLHKLSVDASGVSFVSSLGSGLLGSSTAMSFSHPLVYGAGGIVLDPETKTPVGTFTGLASTGFFPLMTVDAALNRVFFLVGSSGAGGIRGKILAYDKASFVPLGAVDAGPVSGTPSSLIRWGTNGLAFRTSGNQVVLIQTQLVSAVGNVPGVIKFDASDFSANESQSFAAVTVNRTGDASNSASADYATSDGSAKQRKDYTITRGTLSFGPSEISKTFIVPLSDNAYVDGTRKFNVLLSNPVGAGFDGANAATVTITDNDFSAPTTNPLDNSNAVFFVTQHYADFLSRLPDAAGGSFWRGQITQCGSDQACLRSKRIDVSNAFFYELEYQQTGSYVYRLYRAAFGNNQPFPNPIPDANHPGEEKKVPAYPVFAQDRALVVGGANLAQAQLDLANAFVQRSEFILKYPPSLDGPGFVDLVMATIRDDLGTDLNAQRAALITLYNAGGRGAVMYRLADDNLQTNPIDNRLFIDAEYNRAFVATQYFGYLRRDPDMAGFIFWLSQVSSAPLRDVPKQHAMVCSFTTSAEYQQRFSSVVTHSNSECQQ